MAEFEAVLAAAKGKQVVMFLDYDGTLSPIVKDPDSAVMTEEVRPCTRDKSYFFFPLLLVRAEAEQSTACSALSRAQAVFAAGA